MLNEILLGGSMTITSGLVGFFISRKITNVNFDIYTQKAKAKAGAIENEAEILLQKAQNKFESAKSRAKADLVQREENILTKEKNFKRYKQSEDKYLHNEIALVKAKKVREKVSKKESTLLKLKSGFNQNSKVPFLGSNSLNGKLIYSLLAKYNPTPNLTFSSKTFLVIFNPSK